jgi:hypothetical protein
MSIVATPELRFEFTWAEKSTVTEDPSPSACAVACIDISLTDFGTMARYNFMAVRFGKPTKGIQKSSIGTRYTRLR